MFRKLYSRDLRPKFQKGCTVEIHLWFSCQESFTVEMYLRSRSCHIEQTYLLGYWPYKSYKKRYFFKVYIVKKKTRKGHTPPKDYIFELLLVTFL